MAIAASPLGQAQEIILLLKNHPIFSKGNIQVWLDNSIAKACDLFEQILTELPGRVKNFAKTQALFLESRISPQVRVFDKKTLLEESDTPSIFISTPAEIQDSLHQVLIGNWHCYWPIIHPNHFETDPTHRKDLQQLEQNLLSSAASTQAETNITVSCYQLHQHSDVQGTLQLIHNLKPQHVAFSHGTNETTADLCGLDELINRYHLHLPQKGKTLEIMVAKNQLRSEAPPLTEMMLEGELSETPREVQIHLPDSIKTDSRWDAIADSGIILATWQGENLVIKGVSQRELINAQLHPKGNSRNTCFHCSDYQNFVCQQMASPLFALKVTPEGSCQFFTAKEISQ